MNWEELLKILSEQVEEDGKMSAYMDKAVVAYVGDVLTPMKLTQDLTDGSLMLVPVFED